MRCQLHPRRRTELSDSLENPEEPGNTRFITVIRFKGAERPDEELPFTIGIYSDGSNLYACLSGSRQPFPIQGSRAPTVNDTRELLGEIMVASERSNPTYIASDLKGHGRSVRRFHDDLKGALGNYFRFTTNKYNPQ